MARVMLQTSAKLMQPLSLADAWATYQLYRLLPEVSFVGESRDGFEFDAAIQAFITAQQALPIRFWTDMQLASLAHLHGLRVVTFDVDFKSFHLDQLLVLEP
jgi:predicted nucleic acid-binding protein